LMRISDQLLNSESQSKINMCNRDSNFSDLNQYLNHFWVTVYKSKAKPALALTFESKMCIPDSGLSYTPDNFNQT